MNYRLLSIASYISAVTGVIFGINGVVRGGSLLIAFGVVGIALKSRSFNRIEFYLPLAIAVALFALAIALPRGR